MKRAVLAFVFILTFNSAFSGPINTTNTIANNISASSVTNVIVSWFSDGISVFNRNIRGIKASNSSSLTASSSFSSSATTITAPKALMFFAPVTGDYQSKNTGPAVWASAASWQVYNGTMWVNATNYPGQISGTYAVTIKATHTITLAPDPTLPTPPTVPEAIGDVIINGILSLGDGGNSNAIRHTSLNTELITIGGSGNLYFNNKTIRLTLPTNAAIIILSGGQLTTVNPCNNNKEIYIGTSLYAACTGGSSGTFTFGQVVTAGGTVNAEIAVPATNPVDLCGLATVNLTGGFNGPETNVTYQWTVRDPNSVTTNLGASGVLANETITHSTSFTPSMTGQYLVSLKITTTSNFTNVETRTINVNQAPVITTNYANITVNNDAGDCGATVTYATATATGVPAPTITYSQASGTFFPVGTTQVTVTATNSCGTDIKTFDITITDNEAPLISCPTDIVVFNDPGECGAVVTFTDPTATDNCSDVVESVVFTNAGATGRMGPTQSQINAAYTGTALDGAVTINTQGIQEWTVPTTGVYKIEAIGAAGGTTVVNGGRIGGLGASMYGEVTLTAGQVLKIVVGHQGLNYDYTASGGGGSFVTLSDNTPYVIAGGGGGGGDSGGNGYNASTGTSGTTGHPGYAAGTNGYGSTFTFNGGWGQSGAGLLGNGNGYTAGACWGDGSVALAFVNGGLGAGQPSGCNNAGTGSCNSAEGSFGGGATGACNGGGGGGGYSGGGAGGGGGGSFNAGANPTNIAGVNAGMGQVTITFLKAAVIIAQTDTTGLTSGDTFPIGTTTLEYTATDASGNSAICTQTVTVEDNEAPTAIAQDLTVQLDASGNATITAAQIDNGSNDACGIASLSVFPDTFNCDDLFSPGSAAAFTAGSDYVLVGSSPLLNVSNELSVEAWIYPTGPGSGSGGGVIVNKEGEYEVARFADGTIQIAIANTNPGWVWINSGGIAPLNQWTHVAFTYNGNTVNTFINGLPLSPISATGPITDAHTNANSFRIGGRESHVQYFNGFIDEVRIWNVARTQAAIQANMSTELNAPYPAELLGYWSFNEDSGNETVDKSGNGNLGTFVNDTSWVTPGAIGGNSNTVTLTVTDINGNVSTANATVTVEDNEAPTLTVAASDLTVECDGAGNTAALDAWLASYGGAAASDACGIAWSNDFTGLSDLCGETGAATVIFTATDPSNNSVTTTATFTIEDTTVPSIDTAASDLTVACDGAGNIAALNTWLNSNGGASASDICAGVTWSNDFTVLSDDCGATGSATVTFTATDECGKTNSTSATFTIEDTVAPALNGVPSDMTVECDAVPTAANPTASDICDSNPAIAFNEFKQYCQFADAYFAGGSDWTDLDGDGFGEFIRYNDNNTGNGNSFIGSSGQIDSNGKAFALWANGDTSNIVRFFDTPMSSGDTFSIDFDNGSINDGGTVGFALQNNNGQNLLEFYFAGGTSTYTLNSLNGPIDTGILFTNQGLSLSFTLLSTTSVVVEITQLSNNNVSTFNLELLNPGNQTIGKIRMFNANAGGGNDQFFNNIKHCVETNTVPTFGCASNYNLTRTWTATDDCGNASTEIQIITVEDTTAPTWTTTAIALNDTLECSDATGIAAAQALFPIADDNCDGDVTNIDKTSGAFVPSAGCTQAGTYTNTWTVTDDCGNVSEVFTQVITIIDTTAPTWTTTAIALNDTLECSDATGIAAAQALFPIADDNCDGDVTNIDKTSGAFVPSAGCTQAGTYTNTWTVTDDCGNVSEVFTQVITIIDTTAPTWTTTAIALNDTLECSDATGIAAAQALFPIADDNCDGDVTNIDKTSGAFVPSAGCTQAGTYTNTWTVTDDCGNVSEVFTQVITIIDTTAPTWTTVAEDLDRTVECSDATGIAAAQALFPIADDNCDGDVTNIDKTSGAFVPSAGCTQAGTYTNTWTVTDDCGNVSEVFTQVITIIDTTAPTWTTVAEDLDRTVECSDTTGIAAAQALFPIADDNCDGDVTNIDKTSGAFVPSAGCTQAGTYTNTWTVTDDCGNVSEVFTQVITIIDTTAPTWTTVAEDLDRTVECSDATGIAAAQALFPIADDNCDGDVTNIDKTSGAFVPSAGCTQAGTYTNTWTVTDDCGNVSEVFTQVITIIDTTAPTWTTVAEDLDRTVECSDTTGIAAAQALFPIADDNCDGDVTNIDKTSGAFVPSAGCTQAGTYTNTWTVTDDCGNVSEVFTQVITIIDTTAPTWTTVAEDLDRTVECSDATGIAAAQALFPIADDNCDGDVTNIDKTSGAFVPSAGCTQAGTYTNTWTVTDDCGNVSEVFTQVITIIDTTAPTWTTVAEDLDRTVECSDATGIAAAQALFPIADDNCDGDVTNIDKTSGAFVPSAGCTQAGTYTNTWTVTDDCGNVSEIFTQVITIIDTTAPTWTTVAEDLDRTVECSDTTGIAAAQALFPIADDNCDGDVTNIDKTSGAFVPSAGCTQAGTYTNTWTVTDDCGNVSEIFTQVITIIDTTAPTWTTVAEDLDRTVECSDTTGIAAAQALFPIADDNCDGDVTNIDKTSGAFVPSAGCTQAGTYTNTWTVTDDCGNVSEVFTQVITIIDTTAPTWTTTAIALNDTLECSDATGIAAAQALFPIADDNCDGDVTNIDKTSRAFVPSAGCTQAGTYTNTWTVTDDCGNVSEIFTQVITIIDTTAPTWTTTAIALNDTLECSDATGIAAAQALFPIADDNCDGDVTNIDKTSGDFVASAGCAQAGTYTNTWTVTDDCGNVSEVITQVITIIDTTAPELVIPNDVTINCEDDNSTTGTGYATATDNCDTIVDINYSDDNEQGTDPNNADYYNYIITRTWTAIDDCGNVTKEDQVITVQDVTAPIVDCATISIDLDASGNATITAEQLANSTSDNCFSPLTYSIEAIDSTFDCGDIGGDLDALIISEYVDGTGLNKAIEIFNGTGIPVDLYAEGYQLLIYPNGGGTPVTIPLSGVIIDRDVLVVGNTYAQSSELQSETDYIVSNLNFNGTDAIALTKSTLIVDYIPVGSWTEDVTLIRKESELGGSPTGDETQWIPLGQNTFSNLGTHDINIINQANNVLLTVTDVSSNSTTCEAKVYVNDITPPTVVCNEITVELDANGNYNLSPANYNALGAGSDDVCGIASITAYPNSFTCDNVGNNTVTVTVIDVNGNVSTCNTANVIVQDNIAPVATAQDVIVELDASGNGSTTAALVNNGSSDACGIETMTISPSSFTCADVGDNTVTLTVTDNNGNESSIDATVTVEDNLAPVVVCNDLTVTVSNGVYTLSQTEINGLGYGSYDNCDTNLTFEVEDASSISFDCDDIEIPQNVILKVSDDYGNVSYCNNITITVEGTIPVVSITEAELPPFCQGAFVILTANSNVAVSYLWSTGEITESIEVNADADYSVIVTSNTGCTSEASYNISGFDESTLLSSYTILAENEVFLHGSNLVQTGGVGVSAANGLIKLHQASNIVKFGKATNITLNQGSWIGTPIYASAGPIIPAFQSNTYSNAGSPNETINNNQTKTLYGSVYGQITVKQNATVIFDKPDVYIDDLKTFDGASIEFSGCTNVYINKKFFLAQNGTINSGGKNVVMYVNEDVQIEKGSYVRARLHSNGNELLAKGGNANGNNAPEPTQMIGLFICKKVHGNTNVIWKADPLCDPCAPAPPSAANTDTEKGHSKFEINSWPNPSDTEFNVKISSENTKDMISISVFDMSNKLVHSDTFSPDDVHKFGDKLEAGVYIVKVTQGHNIKTVRLVRY